MPKKFPPEFKRDVVTVARRGDLIEDVDGVGDFVGVGDDADEVGGLSASDGDVEPSTGRGGCGEGDRSGGGVALVAGFGGGVAELDVGDDWLPRAGGTSLASLRPMRDRLSDAAMAAVRATWPSVGSAGEIVE